MLANHSNPQISSPCGSDVFIIFELTGKPDLGLRRQKEMQGKRTLAEERGLGECG